MKGMLSTLLASQNTPSGSGAPSVGGDAWSRARVQGEGMQWRSQTPLLSRHGDSGGTMETPWGDPEECAVLSALCGLLAPHGKDIRLATFPKVGAKDAAGCLTATGVCV